MKAGRNDGRLFQHRLDNFLLTYRTSPHATTNATPCCLFLQRQVRTRFDLLKPDTEKHVAGKQAQQVIQHDQHARHRTFVIGQKVMARDFRPSHGATWVPATVVKQLGPVSFVVSLEDGMRWKRHSDHLRACGNREKINFPTELSTGDVDFSEDSPALEMASNSHEPQPAAAPQVPVELHYPRRTRQAHQGLM